jgi:sugar lactone lactonase YvrE
MLCRVVFLLLVCLQMEATQIYTISTVAGGGLPNTATTAAGTALVNPSSVALGPLGNPYFICLNAVFKVGAGGTLTRVAGFSDQIGFAGDGGPATSAWLNAPQAIALDGAGNLYIADSGNNRVRRVGLAGIVTTVAGNGISGYSGDGAAAVNSEIANPTGLAFDQNGNVYIADNGNNAIRRITADGSIATVAQIKAPIGLAIDGTGKLYTASGGVLYVFLLGGTPAVFAGGGNGCGQQTDILGDGCLASAAVLDSPQGIAIDSTGNVFIADSYDSRIRKVSGGMVTTVAGGDSLCAKKSNSIGDGCPATSATLGIIAGVAVDSSGNLFIADGNNRIREVTGGVISTIAGSSVNSNVGDGGMAASAQLQFPFGVALAGGGNLLISDTYDGRIREVHSNGVITTLAGGGSGCSQQTDTWGDGCPATSAILALPYGIAADSGGNVYVGDNAPSGSTVRKIGTDGTITIFAGGGSGCQQETDSIGDGCPAISASIGAVTGVATDTSGNVYFCDSGNFRIREIGPNGIINTIAGNGTPGYSGDGGPAAQATLLPPESIAVDGSGNIYFTDPLNFRVREITAQGTMMTIAGNGSSRYGGDGGPAISGGLSYPVGVAVDGGNVYISDGISNIREVTPDGTISTIAGRNDAGYAGDGGLALNALLFGPTGLAVDSGGDLIFADATNSVVRGLWPEGEHPLLNVTSSHNGFFTLGQAGSYSINISNAPLAGPTAGPVTVTESVPAGMSLSWMAGTGWTCSPNPCTRSDSLGPGQSYPPITAMMVVGSSPPIQAVNQVGVSGGGYLAAGAADVTNIDTPATSPQAQGAIPGLGGGSGTTFTFTFVDPNGWQSLTVLDVLINGALNARNACYFAIVPTGATSGAIYLVDNQGDAGGPFAAMSMPSVSSVQNSQCEIRGFGSSIAASGTTVVLTLTINFANGFSGNKIVYTAAQDLLGYNSGWQALATWGVPGAVTVGPAVGGVTPIRGSAAGQTYTFTFTDPNGWADLAVLNILVNKVLNAAGACYLALVPAAKAIYLVDDQGDAGGPFGAITLPSSSSVNNSQCTISGTGSSITGTGNTVTVVLNMSFSSSFGGNRVFYLAARNNTTGNSGWQAVGSSSIP